MPGPTTEVLNDDLKSLREDFPKFQLEIKDQFKPVEVSQAEVKTQLRILTSLAILGITVLSGTLITGVAGGIGWASKIDYKVDLLEQRFDKLESKSEKVEASVEARFDKLEASMAKILEQTKPK